MFGFTEFEIHKVKGGFVVRLVTGKNGRVVMESKTIHKNKDSAYYAAERWWKRMDGSLKKGEILSPVRFA